jgi:hypothetical protein
MLIKFFYTLRAAKLPVSVRAFLSLLEGLKVFYLARTTLIKNEALFDKFDSAFGAYFKGVELLTDFSKLGSGVGNYVTMGWLSSTHAKHSFGKLLKAAGHAPVAIEKHDKVQALIMAPEFFKPAGATDVPAERRLVRLDQAFRVDGRRACRQDGAAVVACKVLHAVGQQRLLAVRLGDQGVRVVGHDERRHPAIAAQRAAGGGQPIASGLRRRGGGQAVAGNAHGGDEEVGSAVLFVAHHQSQGGGGKVNEELLPGAVHLAHGALEALGKLAVVLAKLRVTPRFDGPIFAVLAIDLSAALLPQEHQRHAFAAQLQACFVHGGDALEMPRAWAIWLWVSSPSNLRRRASLSLHILILTAGTWLLAKSMEAQARLGFENAQHRAGGVDRRAGRRDSKAGSRWTGILN